MVTFKALGLTSLCFLAMGALASGYEESIRSEISRIDEHVVFIKHDHGDVENKEAFASPKQKVEVDEPKAKKPKRNEKTKEASKSLKCLRGFVNKCTR